MLYFVLFFLKEIPLISHLKGSWEFLFLVPLTIQKQNRICQGQILTLAPTTSVLFLCHLTEAAAFTCLLGLELGKSQSETYSLWSHVTKHFAKDAIFSFSQTFLPFCSCFPFFLRIDKNSETLIFTINLMWPYCWQWPGCFSQLQHSW